jgi:hypothetical protein
VFRSPLTDADERDGPPVDPRRTAQPASGAAPGKEQGPIREYMPRPSFEQGFRDRRPASRATRTAVLAARCRFAARARLRVDPSNKTESFK